MTKYFKIEIVSVNLTLNKTAFMAKKIKHKEQFLNFNLVVFGGTGDLALRKIYPALYQRYIDGQLNCKYNIISIIYGHIT